MNTEFGHLPVAAMRRDLIVRQRSYTRDFLAELKPDTWVDTMTALVITGWSLAALIGVAAGGTLVAQLGFIAHASILLVMVWADTIAEAKWRTEAKRLE